jgi:hypothetical protein
VKIDLDIMFSIKIMAYVPPHLRKTNRHQLKSDGSKVENNKSEQSFPVLTTPTPQKASKLTEMLETEDFKQNIRSQSNHFVLPRFAPSRKYKESEVVETQRSQTAVQEDEWTEIVRKKRTPKPEKTFEQMEKEMQEREKEEEETVWNKNEEESCWND